MTMEAAAPYVMSRLLFSMYNPIRNFPNKKRLAVRADPISASRQEIVASGRILKITANKPVITTSISAVFIRLKRLTVYTGKNLVSLSLSSVRSVLIIRETNNKKPSPRINEKDSKRFRRNFNQLFFGFALTDHMKLIDP